MWFTKSSKTTCWRNSESKQWFWEKPTVDFFSQEERGKTWDWKERGRFDKAIQEKVTFSKRESLYDGFSYYFELDEVRLVPKAWDNKPPKIKDTEGQTALFDDETLQKLDEKKPEMNKQDMVITASGKPDQTKAGFNKRYMDSLKRKRNDQNINKIHSHNFDILTGEYVGNEKGKESRRLSNTSDKAISRGTLCNVSG